jgi:TonB family protein
MQAGFALSEEDATKLEADRAAVGDQGTHIALLAYYSASCKSLSAELIKKRRAEHIVWLIQHEPKSELFNIATGIYRIFLAGDHLADPDQFRQAAELWMKQVRTHPEDHTIERNASRFIELGDPATATSLLHAAGNAGAIGSLYSLILLGVVAKDYRTGDARTVDDSARNSDYARQILTELRQSSDAKLIGGAGFWMAVQGGMLYADSKMDWDFTTVSHQLVRRALELDPTTVQLYAVLDRPLPKRGERPPRVFGTSVAQLRSTRIKSVTPVYPPEAKAQGVEGKVTLNLLISPEGKVTKAVITGGPIEFAKGTMDAVSQWQFKPTGYFVFAPAEVTFTPSGIGI